MIETVARLKSLFSVPEVDSDEPLVGIFGIAPAGTVQRGSNGISYQRMYLHDYTGYTEVYAPTHAWEGGSIKARGRGAVRCQYERDQAGEMQPVIYPFDSVHLGGRPEYEILPGHMAVNVHDLERLVELVRGFSTPSLQALVGEMFRDARFAHAFVTLPGKEGGHYPDLGGFLRHSLDVAEGVRAVLRNAGDSGLLADVVVLVALLHDVGRRFFRTWPATANAQYKDGERVLQHRLARALSWLERKDGEAGQLLREVLTGYRQRAVGNVPYVGVIMALDEHIGDAHQPDDDGVVTTVAGIDVVRGSALRH